MDLSPMGIMLILLAAAGTWAVVELALTMRKARSSVEQVTRSANETIEQIQPIIAKLDGAMDDMQPAIKQIDPLVEKANGSLDAANEALSRVNGILGDVSTVSGTAAGVSDAVGQVATNAVSSVSGLVGRIAGRSGAQPSQLGEAAVAPEADQPLQDAPAASGYVSYSELISQNQDAEVAADSARS